MLRGAWMVDFLLPTVLGLIVPNRQGTVTVEQRI